MSSLYHALFFDPLYNSLVLLLNILPFADTGLVVIILTVLVRLILFPLSKKAVLTQIRMSSLAPELEAIKEKYKDKPEEQARRTLALYQEKKVNPFSGIFVIIIQIPIIFALYHIFTGLSEVKPDLLYSFVKVPQEISTLFLGIFDISGKSAVLALLAGLSTYLQFKFSNQNHSKPKGDSFGDNLARSMQVQMKYFFPVIMFFVSYTTSAVIAIYFISTNLFSIGQEVFIRRRLPRA